MRVKNVYEKLSFLEAACVCVFIYYERNAYSSFFLEPIENSVRSCVP